MKNKGNFANNALPLYEVTELTEDEALLVISDYREERTHAGMLSSAALEQYYPDPGNDRAH